MRLVCVSNRTVFLSDHQRPRGNSDTSEYPLSAGKQYVVLGMLLETNQLFFLVCDDWGGPCFAPAGLFELGSFDVPSGWEFGLLSGIRSFGREIWSDPSQAVWGYSELVREVCHGEGLAERDPVALAIFNDRLLAAEASFSNS